MRGRFTDQGGLFSYIAPDKRVPANHPLRKVRELVRDVLSDLNRSLGRLYASEGRPSIPPEQLLSALLLQVFYGIRSERQLMEQLDYNLLYRWFVGLSPDDPVWDPTTFTKNRERLQNGDVFTKFMTRLLNHSQVKPLLSDEHFSVDGTLIEAWASQKSFRPKDGSGDDDDGANFHGQKRKNDTHASTSDPDSRLYRKAAGREAKLCYMGHATMENRHGLAVAGRVTHANGTAERRASETMLKARRKAAGRRITAGEDKAYDTADHVANLRAIGVTPHVTQNQAVTKTGKTRNSAIDERTTRHPGYGMSQSRRAMVECIFGWGKQHGTMRKTKHRGIARVAADFLLNLIAYNLGLAFQVVFRHGAIAARPLGLVEAAVASLDHRFGGLRQPELRHPDRNRDAADLLAGCAAGQFRFGNTAADALGGRRTSIEVGARKHRYQFLPAIARGEIDFADTFLQDLGDQPKHLVADLMAVIVVEFLEVIDVDQENVEGLVLLHGVDLGLAKKFVHRVPVGQSGQCIGVGALLGRLQRVTDRVQFLRGGGEIYLQRGRPRRRP